MSLRLDLLFRVFLAVCLLATPMVLGQNAEWQPVAQGAGLSFKVEREGSNQDSCVVRFREEWKLRRTTSDLAVTYSFQDVRSSQKFSAHFEARNTDTLYLHSCESVVSVVAIKVQRW
jgi:hypothetical protein